MVAHGVISQFDLAVLGADDPLGESFLKLLEEREVAIGQLLPLTLAEDVEATVSFRGEDWPCEAANGVDFSRAQAVVVTSAHAAAQVLAEQVRRDYPAMPILTLDEVIPSPVVAAARLLKVVQAVAGHAQAEAFVTLPVAMAGKAGVDELLNQSRGLFNMESPDPEVFPLQIAFNVLPMLDAPDQRYAPQALSTALAAFPGGQDTGFSVVWAPLFFGASMALHVRSEGPVAIESLRLALTRQDGVVLMESDLPAALPTPATDSAESADIFLGQVRATGNAVRLWLVFDPLRLEALQMVSAVENWIDKPMNSVLT